MTRSAVLVVDDNPIIAAEFASTLRDFDLSDLHVAHDLKTAEEIACDIGLVAALLDVNIGGGTTSISLGLQLQRDGVLVVFASGYALDDLPKVIADFPFIEKPCSTREVSDAFKSILK